MYATAQRVVSPFGTREGINAFLSLHGEEGADEVDWNNPRVEQVAEQVPGVLVHDECDLRPGGNHVRSFLDVVARDETVVTRIQAALDEIERRLVRAALPYVAVIDGIGVRFDAEPGLEGERGEEHEILKIRLLRLLEHRPDTPAGEAATSA